MPGLRKRIIECLTSGFQAGQLLLGADAVEEAAKNNKLACYVLAFDISDGGHHKYAENAKRKDIPCITGQFHAAFYGKLFNKSDKSVLGWLPGTLCDIWMHCNQALQSLSFEFGNVLGDVDSLADENSILKQLQIQLPTA